jgi:hypothetical protein
VWRTYRPDGSILSERKVSEKTVETKTADRTYNTARTFFTDMGINDSIMKLLRNASAKDMHWLSETDLKSTGMATHWINGQQLLEGRTSPGWTHADQQGLVEARRVDHVTECCRRTSSTSGNGADGADRTCRETGAAIGCR